MAGRPVEDTSTSPYAVLRVSRHATMDEIKHAYRDRAKEAHPDTGGSPAAMARVNEAYGVLSDPVRRRDFDRRSAGTTAAPTRPSYRPSARAQPVYRPQSSPRQGPRSDTEEPTRPAEPQPESTQFHDGVSHAERRGQARRYVWTHIEEFGVLAVLCALALSFLATQSSGLRLYVLGIAAFLPAYWLGLQFVYLAQPNLKLITFDASRAPHRIPRHHRRTVIVIALLWIPLSLVWASLMQIIAGLI